MHEPSCPECGAVWGDGQSCTDAFHQMLAWEFEHQLLDVHHLLVLCYHLQHPSLYSPEGLAFGKQLLVQFLEDKVTPQAMRRAMRPVVDSGVRDFKITGTPAAHGAHARASAAARPGELARNPGVRRRSGRHRARDALPLG